MRHSANEILRRRTATSNGLWRYVAVALLVHVAIIALAILVPLATSKSPSSLHLDLAGTAPADLVVMPAGAR